MFTKQRDRQKEREALLSLRQRRRKAGHKVCSIDLGGPGEQDDGDDDGQ